MEGGGGGGGGKGRGNEQQSLVANLVWEDLTVEVSNFGSGATKRVLHGLSGYAEPSRLMAVMGPSGSGKSTLLDSLAGLFAPLFYISSPNCMKNYNERKMICFLMIIYK